MKGLSVNIIGSDKIVEMNKQREERARQLESEALPQNVETSLAAYIRKIWERNRNSRDQVNNRLLSCLRARKGEYSPTQLAKIEMQGGADPIYLKLTGTKSRAAASWIRDIILPVKDKCWNIEPTPIPDLPEDIVQNAVNQTMAQLDQMAAEGLPLDPQNQAEFAMLVKKKTLKEIQALAVAGVKEVELKIEDAMAEGGWKKALEEFIEDFVTYPYAVLKGPYYQSKRTLEWVNGKPKVQLTVSLCWRRVSPFDIFPSAHARSSQDLDLIERLRYTRDQLYDLINVPGFDGERIRQVLLEYDHGKLRNWLWEDFEREYLETSSSFFMSDPNMIDGVHFWGHVKGQDLIDWGYKSEKTLDPIAMYSVDAILINRTVISVAINNNPLGQRPYHFASWDPVPGSLIGIALAEQMEDHQKMVNGAARSLATNLSVSSGPQVSILTDMMADGESITSLYPMKIWQMKSSLTGNSGKPIEFFQPAINASELIAVLNTFEQKADDVTNVPRYSYGNEKIGGAGSTASGLSMLMNSAAKGIRRAIANIDLNVIQPTVYQAFVEVMLKEPSENIRGDIKIVPKGSAAVLIKEQLQANQKEFLQLTANPIDAEIIGYNGRARLLRNIAEELGLDPLMLPSEEELALREAKQRQMAEQQQQAEIAANQASSQPQAPDQQAMMEQMMQAQALEQQAAQMEQQAAQVDMKDKAVQSQAKQIEAESKKLKQLEKQVEDSLAQLAAERIQADIEKAKQLAEIEKARLHLQLEAERVKAITQKAQLVSASKEEETAKEGKESEKKEAKENSAQVAKVVSQAMEQVTKALEVSKGTRTITLERDKDGKLIGATVKETK